MAESIYSQKVVNFSHFLVVDYYLRSVLCKKAKAYGKSIRKNMLVIRYCCTLRLLRKTRSTLIFVMLIFERSQLALLVPVSRSALLLIFERSALLLTGTNSASWLRSKITKISAFLLLLLIFERSSAVGSAPTGTISASQQQKRARASAALNSSRSAHNKN